MDTHQLIEFAGNHRLLVLALFAIVVMLIVSEIQQRLSRVKEVSPAEATRLLNHENATMIDMRTDKDYREGHIANAVNVPTGNADIPASLSKHRERPVIVYCQRGQRSTALCNKLSKQGFESVYNLKGGVLAWQKAELPLTKNN
ncbi:MAG: rhodanese-like domain-containing protein [Gammaproteobacteria bacterium]